MGMEGWAKAIKRWPVPVRVAFAVVFVTLVTHYVASAPSKMNPPGHFRWMSTHGIDALLRKREELLAQIQGLQSAVFHIDQALALIGYGKGRVARRFANGELMALVGEAERAGNQTPTRIAQFIMAAKGMDQSNKALVQRIVLSVMKDCRKRLNAKGA